MQLSQPTVREAECIDCGRNLQLTNPIAGEIVPCPDCGVELEVTRLEPFTLAHAPEEQEDWGE
jgi:alpha-aminoadipate carrier protein LysW